MTLVYHYSWAEEERLPTTFSILKKSSCEGPDQIAAMFIRPLQVPTVSSPHKYLQGLRKLLDKYGILLVCDEVMCGWGRTGKLFGFEHGDIVPDIVTMAKG